MVGVKRDSEEVAIRTDCLLGNVVLGAAVARHLAVHQFNVEVGKLNKVALRSFVATAQQVETANLLENTLYRFGSPVLVISHYHGDR